jgi:hypothetical protein
MLDRPDHLARHVLRAIGAGDARHGAAVGGARATPERRVHRARRDDREPAQAVLGRGVDRQPRRRQLPRDRPDEHEHAAGRREVGQRGVRGVERAQQRDVDGAAVVVGRHLGERPVHRGGRVGDHDIDAAERLRGLRQRVRHRVGVAHVGDEDLGGAVERGRGLAQRRFAARQQRDARAARHELVRAGQADPARAAGDQHALAGERVGPFVAGHVRGCARKRASDSAQLRAGSGCAGRPAAGGSSARPTL